MKKQRRDRPGDDNAPGRPSTHHAAEIVAIALLALAILGGLALATYDPADASWGSVSGASTIQNAVGPFGANLAYTVLQVFGYVSYLLPVAILAFAIALFRRQPLRAGAARITGGTLFILSAAATLALAQGPPTTEADPGADFPPGGLLGHVLALGLASGMGWVGALVVSAALALAALILLTSLSVVRAASHAAAGAVVASRGAGVAARVAGGLGRSAGSRAWAALTEWRAERAARADERTRLAEEAERAEAVRMRQVQAALEAARPSTAGSARTVPPRAGRLAGPAQESVLAAPALAATTPKAPRQVWRLTLRKGIPRFERTPAPEPAVAPTTSPAAPESALAVIPSRQAPPLPQVTDTAPAPRPARTPRPEPAAAQRAPEAEPPVRRAPDPDEAEGEAARSSESEFMAAAAREVAARAEAPAEAPSLGTRATITKSVRRASMNLRHFRLPPTSLLDEPGAQAVIEEAELMTCARQIVDKGAEFGIGGQVLHIHPGPVVTTFELKPDAGVKYSRICNLEDDLALALKAETIRIDRIPGKSTVGIEVPNRVREVISFRELVESDVFQESTSKLTMIVGKTIDGAPYVADLAKMPHLLIAGSTGSGKSVALNAMITSILYKSTPEEVKFILVDPKMLELGMYKDIPHLLTPVVTNPKLASNALKWGVKEMETRYSRLAGCGVRNIEQYNAWVTRHLKEHGSRPLDPKGQEYTLLPFIVIVIDELADLMMVAATDVEDSICRLAQMARAVGIHLILATQRPSVDVITGVIKANLPARIAMRVASKVDSRTILDSNGAEQLLGKGDMLFLPAGSSRLMRVHGPYLSETETASICDYLRNQLPPIYDEAVCEDPNGPGEAGEHGGHDDEHFEAAARIVIERGEASTSYLQRRLKVGYSRAARLVDMLEADGIVGPADGSKVRAVLVGPEWLAELDAARRDSAAV